MYRRNSKLKDTTKANQKQRFRFLRFALKSLSPEQKINIYLLGQRSLRRNHIVFH